MQVELADLRGGDVDVVGAGQVVVVRGAQEAEAVGQRLEHAFGEEQAALLGARAEDLEDQLLLAHAGGAGHVELLGDLASARSTLMSFSVASSTTGVAPAWPAAAAAGAGLGRRRAARTSRLLSLAIIVHSASSPSPLVAETGSGGHSKLPFRVSFRFLARSRARQLVDLGGHDRAARRRSDCRAIAPRRGPRRARDAASRRAWRRRRSRVARLP